jgi:hypothetical protein
MNRSDLCFVVPLTLSIAVLGFANQANAASSPLTGLPESPSVRKVYAGCAAPAPVPTKVFYVDPVHGSNSGNGSQARPWHTLAEVVAAGLISTMNTNPNAPITPGATIYLLSGNHGNILLQGWFGANLVGYDNPSFITIAALPGQTPVLSGLTVLGGNKWAFRGLTIQGLNTTGQYLTAFNGGTDFFLVNFKGPHRDIIFDNNTVLSQPDVSQWTMQNWESNRSSGVQDDGGSCVAVTNNTFQNIGFGMTTQQSTNVLMAGNTIDHFSDDGIDFGSSNLLIEGNTITNSIEDGDGLHRDAMQGQPYPPNVPISHVVISHNTIIRITDPNLFSPAELQGIDAFDGIWRDVLVTHNVVITHAAQGIAFQGAHNIQMTNNILLPDGGKIRLCDDLSPAACMAQPVINDSNNQMFMPRMDIDNGKDGTPSSAVSMTDNVIADLVVGQQTNDWVTTTDTCMPAFAVKCVVGIPVRGNEFFSVTPGTYEGTTITAGDPSTKFRTYDPVNMIYDLRLRPGQ